MYNRWPGGFSMAQMKVVQSPEPFIVQSGDDIGIALMVRFRIVELHAEGFELFDEEALERVKTKFMPANQSQWEFKVQEHGIKHFYRVFAESKRR
jgi:hypothetical protein